jgi:UDP-glucose 4-epimerase
VRALVTGGAGFIGSHIVEALLADGHQVAVVDNFVTGKRRNVPAEARVWDVDIVDPALEAVVLAERPDVVFHEAAQPSVKASMDDVRYDARVNVLGLINVLESCVATGVSKVVFASSGATYGNPAYLPIDEDHSQRPESPYGITKLVAEHYLGYYARDRGLRFTSLRYGNVYGPRQDPHGEAGVVAIFTNQLLAGQTPTIHWDGEQVRDYVYVTDVARANLLAAAAGDGHCYGVGTGIGTSVNQLYALLSEHTGQSFAPLHGPRRAGDLRAAFFDTSRARRDLGWSAQVSLDEGLRRTVDAFRRELAGAVSAPSRPAEGSCE